MAVFRELTFQYNGEVLTFVPSLMILRRIKSRGINNVLLANKCLNGGADLEDLAVVHAEFVRAAGGEITEEDSYGFLTAGDQGEIILFQQAYVEAVLPSVDFGKKQEGQGKTRKPKKATPKT